MSNPNTERNERVSEKFHECPMCCYDCDCTQGNAGGLCLHCNDPLSAEVETEDVSMIANAAAARMRDRCVAAIKTLRATPRGAAYSNAINDAIHKIESLTLDQVQERNVGWIRRSRRNDESVLLYLWNMRAAFALSGWCKHSVSTITAKVRSER